MKSKRRSMWSYPPHQEYFEAQRHEHDARCNRKLWVPELSSLADVVILRCAEVLATSVDELQKKHQNEAPVSSKGPQKRTISLLEYCCFKALATAIQSPNFLRDKHFRRLSFEMMLAWETPNAAVMCFQRTQAENHERENSQEVARLFPELVPLLVHQRSTVGLEAFVHIAPAIPGVADVLSAQFQFNALSYPTGGRLPFRVYDKFLIQLDKDLDKLRHQRNFMNSFFLEEGEIIVEMEERVACGLIIPHVRVSTWPGRLILTNKSLYFEPGAGLMAYGAIQKWDLTADLQQIVEPSSVEPWDFSLPDKAISFKSLSKNEHIIFRFSEFVGCSRRDYWLTIIQEVLYTHQFVRHTLLQGAGKVEAIARSIMSILRFKAVKEALRATPPKPKLLLCFSMIHALPSGQPLSRILEDKLKKETSEHSQGDALLRRISYSKSATYVLSNVRMSLSERNKNTKDQKLYVGEFFLDEVPYVIRVVLKTRSVWTHVDGSEIMPSGAKADNLRVNFSIIKTLFISLRPALLWVNTLLSWDEPFKTSAFILVGSSVIMRGLLQLVFSLLLLGMAAYIIISKNAGESFFSGSIDIVFPAQGAREEMLELQEALNRFEEFLETSNIILLRLRSLLYSVFPKATDQVVLFLMGLAVVVTILPAKALLLLLFWEISTRKLPLREENSDYYASKLKAWWSHIPIAPVYFMYKRES